jgi:hypothetical protein
MHMDVYLFEMSCGQARPGRLVAAQLYVDGKLKSMNFRLEDSENKDYRKWPLSEPSNIFACN